MLGLLEEGDREPGAGAVLGIAGRAKDGEIDTSCTQKGGQGGLGEVVWERDPRGPGVCEREEATEGYREK